MQQSILLPKIVLTFHCLNKLFKLSQKFCKFSASNFKKNSRSREQFFLTVGQNNFGNKVPFLISEDTIPSGINEKECKLCLSQTLWEDTCTNLETARDSFFVLVAAHVNTNGYWKQNRNYNATLGTNNISRSHI